MNQKNRVVFLSTLILIVALFYLFATFLIIPDIQKGSKLRNDIKRAKEDIKNLQNDKDSLHEQYISIESYSGYLKYFQEELDKSDLENLFLFYGKDVKIEEVYKDDSDKVKKQNYVVDFKIDSPLKFYSLVKYINQNSLPIKFDYPIVFEKDDKLIDVKFSVVVYSF